MQHRHAFDSDHGDAFTLLNVVDEWIAIKANKVCVFVCVYLVLSVLC